ncbi:MAG: respiratory nitrate reductase subunit gamma [Desulfomonilaceae bacterium]
MDTFNMLAFEVFPYIALTIFVVGHPYRYFTDPYNWNSKSSELLDKDSLKYGILFIHWGIIITFLGHLTGLLTPQYILDKVGITSKIHEFVAIAVGIVVGSLAWIGLILLLGRRLTRKRVMAHTSVNDFVTLFLLFIVVSLGLYNALWGGYGTKVLYTITPWIRGIVTLTPDPNLIANVPWTYKVHILAALALLGFSPFSRLVHIWSVPIPYLVRSFIVFRRREAELL